MAVVAALPAKGWLGVALLSSFSTAGFAGENVTAPGPRNLLQVTLTGGRFGGFAPGNVLASSATHTFSVSWISHSRRERLSKWTRTRYGRPCFLKTKDGRRVSHAYLGERRDLPQRIQIDREFSGLAVGDDRPSKLLRSEIFRHVTVNMPHWRRGRKCVGWPWSGPPGSMWLFGPMGMSSSSFKFRLKYPTSRL